MQEFEPAKAAGRIIIPIGSAGWSGNGTDLYITHEITSGQYQPAGDITSAN